MADHVPVLVHLTALPHHAARAEDVRDGPAQPRCAIDDEQQRPVRRQSAGHQVAQQAAGDGSGLGWRLRAGPARVSGPPCRSPTQSPCNGPGRPCHRCRPPAGPARPAAGRETPRGASSTAPRTAAKLRCSTSPARSRRPAPGPTCPRTGASTPRRRPRASVCSFSGSVAAAHWKLTSGTSRRPRSAPGAAAPRPAAAPSVTGLSTLPPRHAGRSTWWRPFGATQHCPVLLHHRLQDLQPRRDAQAVERFPDTVHHAEHRQRHLNRDGSRVGGLAGRLPPVMLSHGWQSPFLFASPVLSQDRGRSCHSLHISSKPTAFGTSPAARRGLEGSCLVRDVLPVAPSLARPSFGLSAGLPQPVFRPGAIAGRCRPGDLQPPFWRLLEQPCRFAVFTGACCRGAARLGPARRAGRLSRLDSGPLFDPSHDRYRVPRGRTRRSSTPFWWFFARARPSA